MANYKVRLYIDISAHLDLTVNAENEDEALDKAEEMYGYNLGDIFIDSEEVSDAEILTIVHNDGEVEL